MVLRKGKWQCHLVLEHEDITLEAKELCMQCVKDQLDPKGLWAYGARLGIRTTIQCSQILPEAEFHSLVNNRKTEGSGFEDRSYDCFHVLEPERGEDEAAPSASRSGFCMSP